MLEKKQSSAVNIQYGRFNQTSGAFICINQSFVSVRFVPCSNFAVLCESHKIRLEKLTRIDGCVQTAKQSSYAQLSKRNFVINKTNFIILNRYIITPIRGTRKPLRAFTRFPYYLLPFFPYLVWMPYAAYSNCKSKYKVISILAHY